MVPRGTDTDVIEITKEIGAILFFAALFVGVPLWCAWLVANGIRTGVVRAKGFPYSRLNSPAFFWITVTTYAALAVGMAYFGLLIGLELLQGR